jgi:hypothetical protein
MNTSREIQALEKVIAELHKEYKRNQESRWFSSEYAEGLSVAQTIVWREIDKLAETQKVTG